LTLVTSGRSSEAAKVAFAIVRWWDVIVTASLVELEVLDKNLVRELSRDLASEIRKIFG